MSAKELKELALKVSRGEVFISDQIRNPGLLPMIFTPLSRLDKQGFSALKKKASLLYAAYKDAEPKSINGYPIFTSFSTLTKEEHQKLIAYYKKIRAKEKKK